VRSIRTGIIYSPPNRVTRSLLAEICEVEPSEAIKDDIVRATQSATVATLVENIHLARYGINPLDTTCAILPRLKCSGESFTVLGPIEAAIIAAVKRPIRPNG
jgi:hypothetical protein